MPDTSPNINQYYNRPHTHLDRATVPNASTRELWEIMNILKIENLFDIVPNNYPPQLATDLWEVFLNRYAYERIYTYWNKWIAEFASRLQAKEWLYTKLYELQENLPTDYLSNTKTLSDSTTHKNDTENKESTEDNTHSDEGNNTKESENTNTNAGTSKDTGTISDDGETKTTLGTKQVVSGNPSTSRTYGKTTSTSDYPDLASGGGVTTSTSETVGATAPDKTVQTLDQTTSDSGTNNGTSDNTRTLNTTNTISYNVNDKGTTSGEFETSGKYKTLETADIKKIMDELNHVEEYGRNESEQELSSKFYDYLLRLDLDSLFLHDFNDMFMRSRIIHPMPIQGGGYCGNY